MLGGSWVAGMGAGELLSEQDLADLEAQHCAALPDAVRPAAPTGTGTGPESGTGTPSGPSLRPAVRPARQQTNAASGSALGAAPLPPAVQKIPTARASGWQRTRLMYRTGKLKVISSMGGAKRDSARNMIRKVFDELDGE